MPYKSDAQRRYFHWAEGRGLIPEEKVKEYDEASRGKTLPERLHPKERKRKSKGAYIRTNMSEKTASHIFRMAFQKKVAEMVGAGVGGLKDNSQHSTGPILKPDAANPTEKKSIEMATTPMKKQQADVECLPSKVAAKILKKLAAYTMTGDWVPNPKVPKPPVTVESTARVVSRTPAAVPKATSIVPYNPANAAGAAKGAGSTALATTPTLGSKIMSGLKRYALPAAGAYGLYKGYKYLTRDPQKKTASLLFKLAFENALNRSLGSIE